MHAKGSARRRPDRSRERASYGGLVPPHGHAPGHRRPIAPRSGFTEDLRGQVSLPVEEMPELSLPSEVEPSQIAEREPLGARLVEVAMNPEDVLSLLHRVFSTKGRQGGSDDDEARCAAMPTQPCRPWFPQRSGSGPRAAVDRREGAHHAGDAVAAQRRRLPMTEVDATLEVTGRTGLRACSTCSRGDAS